LEKASTSFRIEWFFDHVGFGDLIKAKTGYMRTSVPKIFLRGPASSVIFKKVIDHFAENAKPSFVH